MEEFELDACPACDSKKIRHRRGVLTRQWRGRTVRIPKAMFWHCEDCGERFYTDADMSRIEEYMERHSVAA